jgi:hypothetical protein
VTDRQECIDPVRWEQELRRGIEFYRLLGLPRDAAEDAARRDNRRRFYVLAGG